jgi:hypothetical protein
MADNVTLPGTGEIVATDDIGGVQFQRVKLAAGAEGVAVDVSDAAPLPVRDDYAEHLLSLLLQALLSPRGYDPSLGRQRGTVVVESGTVTTVTTVSTVTTCSTVTTLSNIAAIGGYSAQMQVMDTNRTGWAQTVRARIT